MAWNPTTDASPSSAKLAAPAPYHRPGLSPWPDRYAWWSAASSRVQYASRPTDSLAMSATTRRSLLAFVGASERTRGALLSSEKIAA
jgi:hypothetical protein